VASTGHDTCGEYVRKLVSVSVSFVPEEFVVPIRFEGPGFHLEPLGPQHNDRDHEAWMSSIDHIRSTPGFDGGGDWPVEMDLGANLSDLEMHARHFVDREGFTYSILDGDDVIGCVYIYPSKDPDYDAETRTWVTASRSELDTVVYRSLSDWISTSWPFKNPHYAPRASTQ
jgi:hypothetical protein